VPIVFFILMRIFSQKSSNVLQEKLSNFYEIERLHLHEPKHIAKSFKLTYYTFKIRPSEKYVYNKTLHAIKLQRINYNIINEIYNQSIHIIK